MASKGIKLLFGSSVAMNLALSKSLSDSAPDEQSIGKFFSRDQTLSSSYPNVTIDRKSVV